MEIPNGLDINNLPEKVTMIPDVKEFQEFFNAGNKKHGCEALKRIQRSFSIRRSTNSATMVFIGLTNAGISHTINRILNQSVMCVEKLTQEIIECTLDLPINYLNIQNAKVRLIDTPGFGDFYQQGSDRSCYPTLLKYFQQQNYIPNFIFLVVNITEKGLGEKTGWFLTCLKKVKSELSEIIDTSFNSNVIVCLTHLCSASRSIQSDPSKIIRIVEEMVEENLGIQNVPVVVGENRAEGHQLRRIAEFFVLPSGSLFPRNIYWEMLKQSAAVDPVGHSLVKKMFDHFARLATMDVDKCMISIHDAQVIKSPPPIDVQDFMHPHIQAPSLVSFEEDDFKLYPEAGSDNYEHKDELGDEELFCTTDDTLKVNEFAELLLALESYGARDEDEGQMNAVPSFLDDCGEQNEAMNERPKNQVSTEGMVNKGSELIPRIEIGPTEDSEINSNVKLGSAFPPAIQNVEIGCGIEDAVSPAVEYETSDVMSPESLKNDYLEFEFQRCMQSHPSASSAKTIWYSANDVSEEIQISTDGHGLILAQEDPNNNATFSKISSSMELDLPNPKVVQDYPDSDDSVFVSEPQSLPEPSPQESDQAQLVMYTMMGVGVAGIALFSPKLLALMKMLN